MLRFDKPVVDIIIEVATYKADLCINTVSKCTRHCSLATIKLVPNSNIMNIIVSLMLLMLYWQMSTRYYVTQQIMVNSVIYARKASIDQFVDGLYALRFLELLIHFPATFEPLFLASKADISSPGVDDILSLLQLVPECNSEKNKRTFSMRKEYVKSLDSQGQ